MRRPFFSILVVVLLGFTSAAPAALAEDNSPPGLAVLSPVIPLIAAKDSSSQYHSQDGLGHYNYGYANGLSTKKEFKGLDGVTRGSYTYVDAEGIQQAVEYTSDSINGFQIISGTNLPKMIPLENLTPIKETPEVEEAKANHMKAIEMAKSYVMMANSNQQDKMESTETEDSPVVRNNLENVKEQLIAQENKVISAKPFESLVLRVADAPELKKIKMDHLDSKMDTAVQPMHFQTIINPWMFAAGRISNPYYVISPNPGVFTTNQIPLIGHNFVGVVPLEKSNLIKVDHSDVTKNDKAYRI